MLQPRKGMDLSSALADMNGLPADLLRDDLQRRVRIAVRAGLDMLVQCPPRHVLADPLDAGTLRHMTPTPVDPRGRAPGPDAPLDQPLRRKRTPLLAASAFGLSPLLDRDPAIQLGKTRLCLLHDHATRKAQQLKARGCIGHAFDSIGVISRQIHFRWSRQAFWVITQPLQERL